MLRFALRLIESLIIFAILIFTFAGSDAIAQTTCGELIGQVFDPSGNVLPKAKVSIINIANGNPRSRVTDKSGYYRVPCLPPGNYRIVASKDQYLDGEIAFAVQLNQKNIVEAPDITLRLATLTGKVFDPGGVGFLNATVTVINENNGEARTALSDITGSYNVTGLTLGNYRVTASTPESGVESSGSFSVTVGEENVIAPPIVLVRAPGQSQNITPPPAQAKEPTGRAQLVRTSDAARSSNFTQTQMTSLPLGGATYMRTFDELALLVAGVAPPPYTPGVRGPGVGFGIGTAGTFSVNGARARSNNFTIDGSDNNDPDVGVRRQGFVALVPQTLESINDFSISTLLWDAEFGRNFGSQVNAVSRYGENKFHGQAYAFFTDSSLNARNAFDFLGGASGGEDPFTRTQAGFTIGGPIARNRTQFFTSFERQIINASTEQHFASPAAKERRFLGLSEFIVESFASRLSRFGVSSGATPLGSNILSFYPLPNNPGGPYGDNTYTEILPADGRGTVLSFRLTHQITDRNAVNARYNFTDDSRLLPSVNRAIRSTIGSDTRSQNLSLIFDSELTDTIFSLARFSFGRTRIAFPEHPTSPLIFSEDSSESVETPFGPRAARSFTGPIGELIVEPFSPVGVNALLFPQGRVSNTFQLADTLSWQRGVHSIKFGGDVRRVQLNSFQDRLYRPQVVFGNGIVSEPVVPNPGEPPVLLEKQFFPGVELAALGISSSILQTLTAGTPNSKIGLRFTELSFFLNDNWRARHNLTFGYGLRYEYNTVPREVNNRIEDAITLRNLPTPASPRFDRPQSEKAFNEAADAYRQIIGGRTGIYTPDRNNFGPHFGFAWDPFSDGKMSVRGGYGIYYDTILGAVVSQSRNVFPNEIPINIGPLVFNVDFLRLLNPSNFILLPVTDGKPIPVIKHETLNQLGGAPRDFVALVGALFLQGREFGGGLAFTLPDKDLRTPYSQQWHVTIERQVFDDYFISAAYVGTRGIRLTRLTTPNKGPTITPTIPFVTSNKPPEIFFSFFDEGFNPFARPTPALGPYQIIEDTASSTYHALQLEARKRFNRNFIFTAAYTWSHALDDVSDLFPIAGAPVLAQDSQNLLLESGDANFDIRQKFAASFVWDLPFYSHTNTGIGRWLSGWQVSAIIQAHTGQPFTLNLPVDANLDGNLTDRPSSTEKLLFFEGHGSRRVALQPGAGTNDFFQFGSNGFVARNTVRGDGFVNCDLALNKKLQLKNEHELGLRVEVFNLLNRANYGIPIRTIEAPGFGSSVETVNPARIVQFAVKYRF